MVRNLRKGERDFAITVGIFVTGLAICVALGWTIPPKLSYAEKVQPVEFRHAFHGEDVGITCDTCHFFYKDGSWAGIPKMEICVDCHVYLLGQSPEEKKFVHEYVLKNKDVKWGLYFRQPECVSFSHSSHVRMARVACETCHGPQGLSKKPTEYRTNRITKYSFVVYSGESSSNNYGGLKKGKNVWGTVRMDECADCHRSRGKSTACFLCHK